MCKAVINIIDEFEMIYKENFEQLNFEGLKYNMELLQKMDLLFKSLSNFFENINCSEESY